VLSNQCLFGVPATPPHDFFSEKKEKSRDEHHKNSSKYKKQQLPGTATTGILFCLPMTNVLPLANKFF
jgi:hypothetical protein